MLRLVLIAGLISIAALGRAQNAPVPDQPMTLERLAAIVRAIDPEARLHGAAMEFTVNDVPVIVITDPVADRMRAMVPIRSAEDLDAAELLRLMQANFDTALDARYAVAHGRLWGVYIHPLSPLERDQFLSGIAQTVNVALTYGQSYSGGAPVFGGGDSTGIYEDLLDGLRRRGQDL